MRIKYLLTFVFACCTFAAPPCAAEDVEPAIEHPWLLGIDAGFALPFPLSYLGAAGTDGHGPDEMGSGFTVGLNAFYQFGDTFSLGLATKWNRFLAETSEYAGPEQEPEAMDAVSVLPLVQFHFLGDAPLSLCLPLGLGVIYGKQGTYSMTALRIETGLDLSMRLNSRSDLLLGLSAFYLHGTSSDTGRFSEYVDGGTAMGWSLLIDIGVQFRL